MKIKCDFLEDATYFEIRSVVAMLKLEGLVTRITKDGIQFKQPANGLVFLFNSARYYAVFDESDVNEPKLLEEFTDIAAAIQYILAKLGYKSYWLPMVNRNVLEVEADNYHEPTLPPPKREQRRLTHIQLSNAIESIDIIGTNDNHKAAYAEIKAKVEAARFDGLVVRESANSADGYGLHFTRPEKELHVFLSCCDEGTVVFDMYSDPSYTTVIGSFTLTANAVATALSMLGYQVVFNAEENPKTIHVETNFTKQLANSEQACCKKLAEAFMKLAKYARQDDAELDYVYDFAQQIMQTIVDVRDGIILVGDDCLTADRIPNDDQTLEK
jgi:hypothetical protein